MGDGQMLLLTILLVWIARNLGRIAGTLERRSGGVSDG